MTYEQIKIMSAIREGIAEGMLIASGIHVRENPYAAGEFLHQQQENINKLTKKTFAEIGKYIEGEIE